MWILVLVLNVEFAALNKMDVIQTQSFKTQKECEYTKKKMLDSFPESIDAAWCEK